MFYVIIVGIKITIVRYNIIRKRKKYQYKIIFVCAQQKRCKMIKKKNMLRQQFFLK